MKIKFLVAFLAVATAFTACKKDNDDTTPGKKLPTGQYRLIESVQYDSAGKDSATVKFPLSSLSLSFDQNKKAANIVGKPESLNIVGSYNVKANSALTDKLISTSKIIGTVNDGLVVTLLQNGTAYEATSGTVTIKAKDKGYLVFSMQK
ncbi:hypothetical protein [Pedobacter hartonius]|uniref:Lipocalin-like domain-containing protein n=1 Tax=Pedobacter hartonius TaxID=425514 RepID=A0A1H4GNT7_9SPHI|nr:hypothetical protein [Pedobacter hartonius]SEB10680.1 hypothetical protein SAMN05443550_110196 [Pedobacter hartonius]